MENKKMYETRRLQFSERRRFLFDKTVANYCLTNEPGHNIQKCLFMFDVNSEGYYSWRSRKNERNKVAADNEENRIMKAIRQICRKAGYNPGKRQTIENKQNFMEYLK